MRLRIFSSPTCVGLRYGSPCSPLRDFSWKRGIDEFALGAPFRPRGWLPRLLIVRGTPTALDRDIHHPARLTFSVVPQFNATKTAQEY